MLSEVAALFPSYEPSSERLEGQFNPFMNLVLQMFSSSYELIEGTALIRTGCSEGRQEGLYLVDHDHSSHDGNLVSAEIESFAHRLEKHLGILFKPFSVNLFLNNNFGH